MLRDADLVVRTREGDLEAFSRLIARHRSRLYDIAREITRDREAAHDVVQEALMRAFRSLAALREPDRVGAWLSTITRRVAQEWRRDGARRPEPVDGKALRTTRVIWSALPEPSSEVAERVRVALAALTERERRAMVLHYLEGRSCKEIATRLGLATSSVRRILHTSRRKVRKEAEAMTEAAEAKVGPRELAFWVNGYAGPVGWNVTMRLSTSLAQTICLAANKRAKTVAQLADEVKAHPHYVQELADDLVEMEVLRSPAEGRYLAGFIALESEERRRLLALVAQPAGEAARRLAEAQPRLRAAFARTPLARQGWEWPQVTWPVYSVLVASAGAARHEPPSFHPPRPERPGGGRWWLGGHERAPDLPTPWAAGFGYDSEPDGFGNGYFHPAGYADSERVLLKPRSDEARVLAALAGGAGREDHLLAQFSGKQEYGRGVLAELVADGYVGCSDDTYRSLVPIFTAGDSDVLTPEVDAVMEPVVAEVVVPALTGVDAQLDAMGYRDLRAQYGEWRTSLAATIMGEAVRFLMEQGVLPRPGDPPPLTFCYLAWVGDLPLLDWSPA